MKVVMVGRRGSDAVKWKTATRWNDLGLSAYLTAMNMNLANSICISLVADKTRLDGKDTLVTALYDPDSSLSCWGPPQDLTEPPAFLKVCQHTSNV